MYLVERVLYGEKLPEVVEAGVGDGKETEEEEKHRAVARHVVMGLKADLVTELTELLGLVRTPGEGMKPVPR